MIDIGSAALATAPKMREGPEMNGIIRAATALVAAATVAGCSDTHGGTATPLHATPTKPGAAPAPSPARAPSDDDLATQTVQAFGDSYNSQNWAAYLEQMCASMRAKFTGAVMDSLKRDRTRAGLTTVNAITVTIHGDVGNASFDAHNDALGSQRVSIPLKREDGSWKVCQP